MRWGQQENQFSHWTIALSEHGYELFLAFVFIGHLFLAFHLPPAEDELYYWAWSKIRSWSYFDHPPMVAWWIRLSTFLFGNSLWAIRFPALLVHFFLLYRLGSLSENKSILVFFLLTPLSLFGAIFMTPDIPLLFFWFVYLIWASQIHGELSDWSDDPVSRVYRQKPVSLASWVIGGSILGLGLLSKYTMALAPLCLGLLLLGKYRFRAWAQGYFVHLVVAFTFFLPVLFFNFTYQFRPLHFQWDHIRHPVPVSFFYTFLGSQIALLGALPFLLLPWLVVNYRSLGRHPALRTYFFFFFTPMIFFLFKSTHTFLEANWALVSYLSFWPLSSRFIVHNSFRTLARSVVLLSFSAPLVISVLLLVHLVHPLKFLDISKDRLAKMREQNELVKQLSETRGDLKTLPVFLTSYQWTSYFLFHGFASAQQLNNTGRLSHFTLNPIDPCTNPQILFFSQAGEKPPQALECFSEKRVLMELPLLVRGQNTASYELVEFTKTEGRK